MKALTLTQPWATLVAIAAKKFETRSWYTSYRGQLAIHASREVDRGASLWYDGEVLDVLTRAGFILPAEHEGIFDFERVPKTIAGRFPLSAVVAIVDLVACERTGACECWRLVEVPPCMIHGPLEHLVGDLSPGRFAWKLENVRRVEPPVLARGARGLWDWSGVAPLLPPAPAGTSQGELCAP